MKVAFVLGTTAGGTGRHVQMLVTGCAVRGIPSVVAGPAETQLDFGFGARRVQSGAVQSEAVQSEAVQSEAVQFEAVQFGDRPNVRDGLAVLRLRQVLARSAADVVHAHGLRAGALAALALSLRPMAAPVPLVVTVHNAPPPSGVTAAVYQALELIVARSATTIRCVSADLEDRMRRARARDVGRALVPSGVQAGLGSAVAGETIRRELGLGQDEGAPGQAAGGPGRAAGGPGRAAGGPGRAAGGPGRAAGGPGGRQAVRESPAAAPHPRRRAPRPAEGLRHADRGGPLLGGPQPGAAARHRRFWPAARRTDRGGRPAR